MIDLNKNHFIRAAFILCCSFFITPQSVFGKILKPNGIPQLDFGIQKLKEAIAGNQITDYEINFVIDEKVEPQGYLIASQDGIIQVSASDSRGLMYGALELTELINIKADLSQLKDNKCVPYIKKRGLKFNIPLDARTPSYDDSGDAAQANIAYMWSMDFWKDYLDQMAIHRFNSLTLWNPHPFPSMIKMDNYPEVALDDVCVTTLKIKGYENEWGEPGLVTNEVVENLKVIKKITIDEKIEFWTNVFNYAQNRGIDIYFYNWNICPNSVATPVEPFYKTYKINMKEEVPGKYGITHQLGNKETIKYYRECMRVFLSTYPQIKGIGVTAGEHMPLEWNGYNRERWLWETYGLGILDAKKDNPNRKIDFIHRVWHSNMEQIMNYWGNYPDSFSLSFKYAKARLYSHPNLPFSKRHIEETSPYGLKSWWNLRNDDIYVYRWGDSDYVRSFIKHIPIEHTEGTHMGSDGYVWGQVFSSKNPERSNKIELEKHWNRFYLWGRLSFDPTLNEERIEAAFSNHLGTKTNDLYNALKSASKGIPLINIFHWRDWDHMWSVESCSARPKLGGFRTVFDFSENKTLANSQLLSPHEFSLNPNTKKKGPFEVSKKLKLIVKNSEQYLSKIRIKDLNVEETAFSDDIRALNQLSLYYANKIDAATYLALFKEKKELDYHDASVKSLSRAIENWSEYASISNRNYIPQHLARVHLLDWTKLLDENLQDLEELKSISLK